MSRGTSGGEQAHQLTLGEIPSHKHQALASSNQPDSNTPSDNFWAVNPGYTPYGEAQNNPMSPGALGAAGADTPHNNMAPYLALNICIATVGIFPDPTSKSLSDEYIGEARMFAGKVIPNGWLPCDGQLLNAGDSKYTALFGVIGPIYGANGIMFNLPNLQDAAAVGSGEGKGLTPYLPGETGGAPTVPLAEKTMPVHTHAARARQVGTTGEPDGLVWANPPSRGLQPVFYASAVGTPQPMHDKAIAANGGGQPHNNLMPYTVVVFCIATAGLNP